MDYKIYVDASADVDSTYIQNGLVNVLTMRYSRASVMLESDGNDNSDDIKKFYAGQRDGDVTRTEQLDAMDYKNAFETLLLHGVGIIYKFIEWVITIIQFGDGYKEKIGA